MGSARLTSVLVGCLFITATAGYIGGQAIHGPLVNAPDPLATVHPQRLRLLLGASIELVGILAIPLIATTIFPILKRLGEAVALSYVALRTVEALLLLLVLLNVLAIADASQAHIDGAVASADLQNFGASLQPGSEWPFLLSVGIVFPLGALLLNWGLYRGRLVPRAISAWGFLGGTLLLLGSVLDLAGVFSGMSRVAIEVVLLWPNRHSGDGTRRVVDHARVRSSHHHRDPGERTWRVAVVPHPTAIWTSNAGSHVGRPNSDVEKSPDPPPEQNQLADDSLSIGGHCSADVPHEWHLAALQQPYHRRTFPADYPSLICGRPSLRRKRTSYSRPWGQMGVRPTSCFTLG